MKNIVLTFILGLSVTCPGQLVLAQDQPNQFEEYEEAFYIREGERAPSEIQAESLPYITRQAITAEDQKTKTYHDLKHYFKDHKWIGISISFYGYFNEKVQRYEETVDKKSLEDKLSVLLSKLPSGSYREVEDPLALPSLYLEITKEALDFLYNNDKVNAWYIDRELSSY